MGRLHLFDEELLQRLPPPEHLPSDAEGRRQPLLACPATHRLTVNAEEAGNLLTRQVEFLKRAHGDPFPRMQEAKRLQALKPKAEINQDRQGGETPSVDLRRRVEAVPRRVPTPPAVLLGWQFFGCDAGEP